MYYPKSKITENLKASFGQFILKDTAQPYQGLYFSTFDGKYFTGGSPSDDSKELLGPTSVKPVPVISPSNHQPVPTDADYAKGEFIRYASKRVNSGPDTIMEISKETADSLKTNPLYLITGFSWKITGPLRDDLSDKNHPIYGVLDINKRVLKANEYLIPGISKVFINLIEFYK
jgi:hypothetical protein